MTQKKSTTLKKKPASQNKAKQNKTGGQKKLKAGQSQQEAQQKAQRKDRQKEQPKDQKRLKTPASSKADTKETQTGQDVENLPPEEPVTEELEFLVDPSQITDDIDDDLVEIEEGIDEIPDDNELQEIMEGESDPDENGGMKNDAATELDDMENEAKPTVTVAPPPPVAKSEWTCSGCFLKVVANQFGNPDSPTCPSGESICPAIKKFF